MGRWKDERKEGRNEDMIEKGIKEKYRKRNRLYKGNWRHIDTKF